MEQVIKPGAYSAAIVPALAEEAWYAVMTRPRHEKKVAEELSRRGVCNYVPLMTAVHCWSDRKKVVSTPLFPGYVFAKVPREKKARIYQQDLLARAITVEDEEKFLHQLGDVKTIVASGFELSVMPLLTKGRKVKIVGGPLHGVEGYVDDPAKPQGVVIAIDVLQQGLLVKVPAENLQVLP